MTRPAETRHITQDASLADPETKAYIDIEDFEGILTKALTGGSAADLKYVTNQTSPTYLLDEQTIRFEGESTLPESPNIDGYDFNGWAEKP